MSPLHRNKFFFPNQIILHQDDVQISQAKAKAAPIPIATVSIPYPHLATVFAIDSAVDVGALPALFGALGSVDVLRWVIVEVFVLELAVEFMYSGVVVVVPVDVEDAAAEVDDEDALGNEVALVPVEAEVPVTEADVTDDAIENIGE